MEGVLGEGMGMGDNNNKDQLGLRLWCSPGYGISDLEGYVLDECRIVLMSSFSSVH